MTQLFSENVNVLDNLDLRVPQREGYRALSDYFSVPGTEQDEVGIVLPVGTGKSGLIALTPFAVRARRALIIAPGLRVAEQLLGQLDKTSQQLFYRRFHVLDNVHDLETADIRGNDTNITDLEQANIVVTNIHQLQRKNNSWLTNLPRDFFDLIINDEAHHNVAESWNNVRKAFPKAKIVNFSATPDRADGQRMAGKIIYSFPVFRAIQDGYVKRLSAVVLNPRTLRYVRRSAGNEVIVDLDEVKKLGEEDADFRRSIVSSAESLATIVDASIRELEHRRSKTGNNRHKIIASALNMEHCIQITEAYRARNLRCEYVHSKLDSKINDRILSRLHNDELDAIVQVRMLGEGFDHPYFSVAAVLSIYSNLSPFVQFVGRIMRTISPGHDEDNEGTVVFHAGANVASLWGDFQDFSTADQDFFDQLLPVRNVFIEDDAADVRVTPEIRQAYEQKIEITTQGDVGLESIPLIANDRDAQDAIALLHGKGITVEDFRRALEVLTPVNVSKQRHRRAARLSLDAQIRTFAARILNERMIPPEGHELDKQHLGRTNYIIVKSAIDRECNRVAGKGSGSRSELSQDQLDKVVASLPTIAKSVVEKLLA